LTVKITRTQEQRIDGHRRRLVAGRGGQAQEVRTVGMSSLTLEASDSEQLLEVPKRCCRCCKGQIVDLGEEPGDSDKGKVPSGTRYGIYN
jgi:hypothetical protein